MKKSDDKKSDIDESKVEVYRQTVLDKQFVEKKTGRD